MKRLTFVLLITVLVLCIAPLAVARAGSLCGFGESYAGPDGASRTHRGIDIALTDDGRARSLVSGTVRFVGRVPAAEGGTVLAVSVTCAQGIVTLMPLDDLAVAAGDDVCSGTDLGTAAGSGDPSSSTPHLHLSLRRGDLYLDPSVLLPALAETTEGPSSEAAEPAPAPAPCTAPVPDAGPVSAAPAQTVPRANVSGVQAGAAVAQAATGGEPAVSDAGMTHQAVREPGTQEVHGSADAVPGASPAALSGSSSGARPVSVPGVQLDAMVHRCASTFLAPAQLAIGVASLALMLFAGVSTVRRHAWSSLTSCEPVSDRLGMILQQLRTGATLLGLNSCSGHTAFTVPEPFSPEEVKI